MAAIDALTPAQRRRLDRWLPGLEVLADHSWGLVSTRVLEVGHGGTRHIVKAADVADSHLPREVRAHRTWLEPWTSIHRAPSLEHADLDARIIVTTYQPGHLVEGTHAQDDPDTYRQAGELLSRLHAQPAFVDVDHEARDNARAIAFLDEPHRVSRDVEARLRAEIAAWPTPPTMLVPTHGDWQPRNWLVHDGEVSIIDLGRADLRPVVTDLTRLAAQDFGRDPLLEARSSTATAPTRASPRRGTGPACARRSARPCGPSGSQTSRSRPRGTG